MTRALSLLALALVAAPLTRADEALDARQAMARHGGRVVSEGAWNLEVVVADEGVRIYPMDRDGDPHVLFGMGGIAVVRRGRLVRRELPLGFVPGSEGGAGHLAGLGDLEGVADGRYQLHVALEGMPGRDQPLRFTLPFARTPPHAGPRDD